MSPSPTSPPLSLASAFCSEPRWSIAAAAITPRSFETAFMPASLPAEILTEVFTVVLHQAVARTGRDARKQVILLRKLEVLHAGRVYRLIHDLLDGQRRFGGLDIRSP